MPKPRRAYQSAAHGHVRRMVSGDTGGAINAGKPAEKGPSNPSHMQHGETEACLPICAAYLADEAA
jgi:hypothetical protein